MRAAIHQPHYLPWLGYLAKWAAADVLIVLDTVQYEKNGWQNRNKIKGRHGPMWLTVPVHAALGTPIREVRIDRAQPWRLHHLRAIEHAYAGTPELARHRPALRELYARDWDRLVDVALASAGWLAREYGITTPVRLASELGVSATDPTGRLVALCRAVGATAYLAGQDGPSYLDGRQFEEAGIAVHCQRFVHPVYPQRHGEFVPFLSSLDLLLNSSDMTLDVLSRGNGWSRLPHAGSNR
jgi:hypothetical protein